MKLKFKLFNCINTQLNFNAKIVFFFSYIAVLHIVLVVFKGNISAFNIICKVYINNASSLRLFEPYIISLNHG